MYALPLTEYDYRDAARAGYPRAQVDMLVLRAAAMDAKAIVCVYIPDGAPEWDLSEAEMAAAIQHELFLNRVRRHINN